MPANGSRFAFVWVAIRQYLAHINRTMRAGATWIGGGRNMIRYSLAVLAAVFWVTSEAAAIECSAEPQSGKGHWSWRTIDGKKCWYPGRPGISKDKLRWPATTVGQGGDQDPESALAAAAEPATLRDAVAPRQDDAQPARALTFKERWPH
jgi:hypothetical protein